MKITFHVFTVQTTEKQPLPQLNVFLNLFNEFLNELHPDGTTTASPGDSGSRGARASCSSLAAKRSDFRCSNQKWRHTA